MVASITLTVVFFKCTRLFNLAIRPWTRLLALRKVSSKVCFQVVYTDALHILGVAASKILLKTLAFAYTHTHNQKILKNIT